MNTTTQTIFVGMSGGVDSSVAAARLLQRGYKVVGVFIKVWQPDFITCNWEAERLDAMRVAARLGIPFLTCDAEAVYKKDVADYFISEYLAGRTPNPDVMCNKYVKFGAFMEFAQAHGADGIATGHYVQRLETATGPALARGVDTNKDQSYFLWSLSNEQLAYSLFPIGDTRKDEIRREAAAAALPTANKDDSQGICFLGHIDIADFLSHYTTLIPGAVLDTAGATIGEHDGALIYTTGQRHGFRLQTLDTHTGPQYVQHRDLEANTITVGPKPPTLPAATILNLESVVLRHPDIIQPGMKIQFQTRYRQTPLTGHITAGTDTTLSIAPDTAIETMAAGQSCVLYQGQTCLGGGIMQ